MHPEIEAVAGEVEEASRFVERLFEETGKVIVGQRHMVERGEASKERGSSARSGSGVRLGWGAQSRSIQQGLWPWSPRRTRLVFHSRQEANMASYVILLHYTEQGVRNIKESPSRLDAAKKAFQAAGGELKQFYLAMGRYDAVIVGEAPDDETAARLALAFGSLGNVRTETMRVFTESEYRKIIGSLK